MAESELILANSMGLSSNSLAMIHFMGGTIEDLTMEVTVSGVDILPYIAEDGIEVTLRAIDGDEAGRTMDAYSIPEPLGYACEEILGYIAAMYGGSFCIGDNRYLLLVQLKGGGGA